MNSSLVATSICRNLERFSRTLIEVPSLAGLVRSVTVDSAISSDTKYAIATQDQRTLELISRIESVHFLGHWKEYWTLNSYLTLGGQPSTSTMKKLTLSTFGITETDVLAILQFPQLKKLSIRSITSPSSPLSGADVQRNQFNSSSFPALEHLELGPWVKCDIFTGHIISRCDRLKSLHLIVEFPWEERDDELQLRRFLAPLANTLQSLKLRARTGWKSHLGIQSAYKDSLRLVYVTFTALKSLDVTKGFLFPSIDDIDDDNFETTVRDGLHLRLPRTLETLTVSLKLNQRLLLIPFDFRSNSP